MQLLCVLFVSAVTSVEKNLEWIGKDVFKLMDGWMDDGGPSVTLKPIRFQTSLNSSDQSNESFWKVLWVRGWDSAHPRHHTTPCLHSTLWRGRSIITTKSAAATRSRAPSLRSSSTSRLYQKDFSSSFFFFLRRKKNFADGSGLRILPECSAKQMWGIMSVNVAAAGRVRRWQSCQILHSAVYEFFFFFLLIFN